MSLYPDGSRNQVWERMRVILPRRDSSSLNAAQVPRNKVSAVVCHRKVSSGHEEYLVQWRSKNKSSPPPYSWHDLSELSGCLSYVQSYVDSQPPPSAASLAPLSANRKRRNDDDSLSDRSGSPALTSRSASSSRTTPSFSSETISLSQQLAKETESYSGRVKRHNGIVHMETHAYSGQIMSLPTAQMKQEAASTDTRVAQYDIRTKFDLRMNKFAARSAPLDIINQFDGSRPPLTFRFIPESVLGEGVKEASNEFLLGCGFEARYAGADQSGQKLRCSPHMGQDRGCEYGRVCDCLEYAAVDEDRLTATEKARYNNGDGDATGLPKRFPYQQSQRGNMQTLQPFYLKSRHAIYECNLKCQCGPNCKTRLVQKGRTVPLQIFKTAKRGWGLRCPVDLVRGQFIDTYRGEIITDAEATKREAQAVGGLKSSYLYELDKHAVDDDDPNPFSLKLSDCYSIDGEYQGGPTRFINHSCDPNVRQFSVQYNKHDRKVYELAFFALHNIPAMTELTFDYQDKDDEDEDKDKDKDKDTKVNGLSASQATDGGATKMNCRCGSKKCRGALWM